MTTIYQYSRLFVFPFFVIFILFTSSIAASELPDANSINKLSEESKIIWEAFLNDSLRLRMAYECSGDLLSEDDRKALRQICDRALSQLQVVEQQQKDLQKQIEDYEGDDWEQRYGTTELWRKIKFQSQTTNLDICAIRFSRDITYTGQEKQQLLKTTLEELNKLQRSPKNVYLDFLQARILEALGQTSQKEKLLKEQLRGPYKDDAQLALVLAFLHRRQKQFPAFEKTLGLYPRVQDFAGELILDEIQNRLQNCESVEQIAEQLSPVEAQLIAKQMIKRGALNYQQLLEAMINRQELRLPGVFYAASCSVLENQPQKATEFLIEASQLQQKQKSTYLDVDASRIAELAAKMAFNLYIAEPNNCEFVIKTFQNYEQLSSNTMTDDLEYTYAKLLCSCSHMEQGNSVFRKIAGSDSKYSTRAKFWLATDQIQTNAHADPNQKLVLLNQFAELCEDMDSCRFANEMFFLVKDTIEKIEDFEKEPQKSQEVLRNSLKIVEFLDGCKNKPDNKLLLAEINILLEDASGNRLIRAEKLIEEASSTNANNPDLLRCRGRFFQKKREFEPAAGFWIKLGRVVNQQSYDWWRAKYYQLYCFSCCELTQDENIEHAIDVLQGSFENIPNPWAEKLETLKQQCYR